MSVYVRLSLLIPSDESISAAKNVTVCVVSIAGGANSAAPPPGD